MHSRDFQSVGRLDERNLMSTVSHLRSARCIPCAHSLRSSRKGPFGIHWPMNITALTSQDYFCPTLFI